MAIRHFIKDNIMKKDTYARSSILPQYYAKNQVLSEKNQNCSADNFAPDRNSHHSLSQGGTSLRFLARRYKKMSSKKSCW